MDSIGKIKKLYRDEGIRRLVVKSVKYGYNKYVRPHFPRRQVIYNGVPVLASHWGDRVVPWETTDVPEYEGALVRGIRRYVSKGDHVVIVGGGWGVTSVVAARQAGAQGQVSTYEGSVSEVKSIEHTIGLNDVSERVNVRHAVVAEAISLRGDQGDARIVTPSELPECDMLVLDCEGAEMKILENMDIRPKTALVETHGIFDATKEDVSNLLKGLGYDIVTDTVAEERVRDICEENEIYVLAAEYT